MTSHAGPDSIITQVIVPSLIDQSAANTTSTGVDMQGYDRVRFLYNVGAMVASAVLVSWVVESNESNLGNATNVSGIINGTGAAAAAALPNVAQTSNNNVFIIDVHRPSKRYVGVVVDAATANITSLSVLAERFRGTGVVPPASPAAGYTTVQAN